MVQVIDVFFAHPVMTIKQISSVLQKSSRTLQGAFQELEKLDIVSEIVSDRRSKQCQSTPYLALIG